jgi:hypothetical protein
MFSNTLQTLPSTSWFQLVSIPARRYMSHAAPQSCTEKHLRTAGPAGELTLAISAWIAKQERLRISEQTKAANRFSVIIWECLPREEPVNGPSLYLVAVIVAAY